MNSKSSKIKVQSSREAPEINHRASKGNRSGEDWWQEAGSASVMFLRDGPSESPKRHPWDLEERTSIFGEGVVRCSKRIPRDPTNNRLIDQLVGAGTSVGANYCEANEAVSKKDFKNTVSRCMKEAKETKFFLRMVAASEPQLASEARVLYREAHELLLIFGSMRHKNDL
jgi:four helix bundle protein